MRPLGNQVELLVTVFFCHTAIFVWQKSFIHVLKDPVKILYKTFSCIFICDQKIYFYFQIKLSWLEMWRLLIPPTDCTKEHAPQIRVSSCIMGWFE